MIRRFHDPLPARSAPCATEEQNMKILILIGVSSLFAALALAPTPSYTVTDLGTFPGGDTSFGFQLNNAGMKTFACSELTVNAWALFGATDS
jgi:hypothetical protein